MAKIGVLAPSIPGHLNPVSCLGRELQSKGHSVTAFQPPYFEEAIRRSGLNFEPIGAKVFSHSRLEEHYARLGSLQGMSLLRYSISFFVERSQMFFAEAPEALSHAGIDLLLVDQVEPAGACVAERIGLPFVTLSNALVTNQEPNIPPLFTSWPFVPSRACRFRNQLAYRLLGSLTRPWLDALNTQRREWRLPEYRSLWDSSSPWAHISQQPACFDFPRQNLLKQFHYTGPWHDRRVRPAVSFPYEKLDGRPLIYASMGTLQNRAQEVFHEIAEACEGLDAQLVISLGGGNKPEQIGPLPGNPIVVPIAPQLELLSRAALTITHAGLNTALESLSFGVPMVAIPVGNDQPGVAARLKWLGAGEFLPLKSLQARRLRPLVKQVLAGESYRRCARHIQEEIQIADGVQRALQIIELVLNEQWTAERA